MDSLILAQYGHIHFYIQQLRPVQSNIRLFGFYPHILIIGCFFGLPTHTLLDHLWFAFPQRYLFG